MPLQHIAKRVLHSLCACTVSLAMLETSFCQNLPAVESSAQTETPIKHVIIIVGENRTFDHLFATYKPRKGQTVDNLLSKGILKENEIGRAHV